MRPLLSLKSQCEFLLLQLRLSVGRRILGPVGRLGVQVSRSRIIKGPCGDAELIALEYVQEHTTVPVPRLYQVFRVPDDLYIELESVAGADLSSLWGSGQLSRDQKRGKASWKKSPDNFRVSSIPFDALPHHRRLPLVPPRTHPGRLLRRGVRTRRSSLSRPRARMRQRLHARSDICPRNIIITPTGTPVLIDWELAGWRPEYWEYTKAFYPLISAEDWYELFDLCCSRRYGEELVAERKLWRVLDQPW
ncbi:MAG: hypothetical protein M1819_003363 [Sarea resinae]|nr:MAG: hypothetical protein M1819_003363 [Sarea resinae]